MNKQFKIGNKLVGENAPAFIVAEISGNHNQDYNRAVEIIHAAKEKKFTHCIQGKLNNYNGLFLIRNNEGQKEIE